MERRKRSGAISSMAVIGQRLAGLEGFGNCSGCDDAGGRGFASGARFDWMAQTMKLRFDIKTFAKNTWSRLHQLRDAPHAVAGGVAIGIFWGFTPLTGLKTLLSIFFAWVLRCSKIPAVIAVT